RVISSMRRMSVSQHTKSMHKAMIALYLRTVFLCAVGQDKIQQKQCDGMCGNDRDRLHSGVASPWPACRGLGTSDGRRRHHGHANDPHECVVLTSGRMQVKTPNTRKSAWLVVRSDWIPACRYVGARSVASSRWRPNENRS